MIEDLQQTMDDVFAMAPDVFYLSDFIKKIVYLPIPELFIINTDDIRNRREDEAKEYILERCDHFNDVGICVKYDRSEKTHLYLALIHRESRVYTLSERYPFVELRGYARKSISISINANNITHIVTETGDGSSVSIIHLNKELEF